MPNPSRGWYPDPEPLADQTTTPAARCLDPRLPRRRERGARPSNPNLNRQRFDRRLQRGERCSQPPDIDCYAGAWTRFDPAGSAGNCDRSGRRSDFDPLAERDANGNTDSRSGGGGGGIHGNTPAYRDAHGVAHRDSDSHRNADAYRDLDQYTFAHRQPYSYRHHICSSPLRLPRAAPGRSQRTSQPARREPAQPQRDAERDRPGTSRNHGQQ